MTGLAKPCTSIHPMASPTFCLVSIEVSSLTVTSDCSCLVLPYFRTFFTSYTIIIRNLWVEIKCYTLLNINITLLLGVKNASICRSMQVSTNTQAKSMVKMPLILPWSSTMHQWDMQIFWHNSILAGTRVFSRNILLSSSVIFRHFTWKQSKLLPKVSNRILPQLKMYKTNKRHSNVYSGASPF